MGAQSQMKPQMRASARIVHAAQAANDEYTPERPATREQGSRIDAVNKLINIEQNISIPKRAHSAAERSDRLSLRPSADAQQGTKRSTLPSQSIFKKDFGATFVRGGRFALNDRVRLFIGVSAIGYLVLAILFVGFMVSREKSDLEAAAAASRSAVLVPVPTEEIPAGTAIKTITFKQVSIPASSLPESAISKVEELLPLYVASPLSANQPILRNQVTAQRPALGIDGRLPKGYRAITLEVNAASGVEGWATPGVFVDVTVTFVDPYDNKKKTQLVAERSVVLSYNGQMNEVIDDKTRTKYATVTLGTPIRSAMKIQTAQALGKISLILRSAQDLEASGATGVSMDEFALPPPKPQLVSPRIVVRQPEKPQTIGTAKFTTNDGSVKKLELLSNGWTEQIE